MDKEIKDVASVLRRLVSQEDLVEASKSLPIDDDLRPYIKKALDEDKGGEWDGK
jgi:hypothetical protein